MISIIPRQRNVLLVLIETLFFITIFAGAVLFTPYLASEVCSQPPPFPHIRSLLFFVGALVLTTVLGVFSAISQVRHYVVLWWLCYHGLFLAAIGYTVLLGAAVSPGELLSWLAGISFPPKVMIVAMLSVIFFAFNVPYFNMVATARREDGAGLIVLQHLCRALEWILVGVGRVMCTVGRGLKIFARDMRDTLGFFYSHTLKAGSSKHFSQLHDDESQPLMSHDVQDCNGRPLVGLG